ncbi:hypothetical protein QCA50_003748 [Cerrena zonata]|uniref:Uncharacterized protein n=1 Tax=Cerrena zonata TaxID=2478898 RepID=A0AAW0GJZ7_9APHY
MGRGSKSGRGSNRGGGFRGGRGDGRGRGRGTPDSNRGRGGGKYISMNEIDSEIQQYAEEPVYHTDGPKRGSYTPGSRGRGGGSGYPTPRGTSTPRGRGRGNSGRQTPNYNGSPSRGRGQPSFYGPQRGRGSKSKSGPNAPLSKLLYEDRPMLKPIVFVRSVHTATLFKEEEDILKAAVEKPEGEESHVPTADKVSQIFNEAAEENDEQLEEELEEIDFSEVGRIQAQVDTIAATLSNRPSGETAIVEEKFTGFYIDPSPASVSHIFSNSSRSTANILGIPEGDDEEIVYVAPHPRAGPVTPVEEKVEFKLLPTTSILTGLTPPMEPSLSPESSTVLVGESEALTAVKSEVANTTTTFSEKVEPMHGVTIDTALDLSMEVESSTTPTTMTTTTTQESETVTIIPEASCSTLVEKTESAPVTAPVPSFESFSFTKLSSTPSKLERMVHPVNTPRSLLKKSKAARSARKLHHFGSYGAMLSEAHLREEANGKKKDP